MPGTPRCWEYREQDTSLAILELLVLEWRPTIKHAKSLALQMMRNAL